MRDIKLSRETPDHLVAGSLAFHAAALAEEHRRRGLSAQSKSNLADLVTEADAAAEEYISQTLGHIRPEDSILGEEGSARHGSSQRTWIIDPVDGTYNFFTGSGPWCSALALAEEERVKASAVYVPEARELFIAKESEAFLVPMTGGEDAPSEENLLQATGLKETVVQGELAELSVGTYLHPSWMKDDAVRQVWHRAVTGAATLRMSGSGSVDLARVAAGRLGVWFQHSVPAWDWLPGKALVEASGGVTARVVAGGVKWSVAGGAHAVSEVLALLQHDAIEATPGVPGRSIATDRLF